MDHSHHFFVGFLQVVHEADMIDVLKTRPDFCYLCDVAPKDLEPYKAAVGDKCSIQTANTANSDHRNRNGILFKYHKYIDLFICVSLFQVSSNLLVFPTVKHFFF